jgi:hypothetical protein
MNIMERGRERGIVDIGTLKQPFCIYMGPLDTEQQEFNFPIPKPKAQGAPA